MNNSEKNYRIVYLDGTSYKVHGNSSCKTTNTHITRRLQTNHINQISGQVQKINEQLEEVSLDNTQQIKKEIKTVKTKLRKPGTINVWTKIHNVTELPN